ncbi:hypothetical protein A5780_08775 [Nocardia sp. 852002-20019_SCH5090214]|uniref:hypothetical protein n=1 Tax=Nocardia sp. 852002-20019_SCH5090214 TaxID=1834087 RepID=UPI0007EADA3F|nr:hypothetical protein [Nocardia sp. 852002-20019_SCH5090214]OBA68234.1 hypothetical protein A5780_08775 [Nocardia sp. 852002-20019_SCH5090214]
MKPEDFFKLTQAQRDTLVISMIIRNEMEDFHAEHLTDEQMKQLNPIIRQAVFDAVNLLAHVKEKGEKADELAYTQLAFQIGLIPDYWEIPLKVGEGFVQHHERSVQRRSPDWAAKPELKPLYDRFLTLGDFERQHDDELSTKELEVYLGRKIGRDEPNQNLRWRIAQEVIKEELRSVVAKMRALGTSQQQLMDARGELSRSFLRELF